MRVVTLISIRSQYYKFIDFIQYVMYGFQKCLYVNVNLLFVNKIQYNWNLDPLLILFVKSKTQHFSSKLSYKLKTIYIGLYPNKSKETDFNYSKNFNRVSVIQTLFNRYCVIPSIGNYYSKKTLHKNNDKNMKML